MKGWHTLMDQLEAELSMDEMPDQFPEGAPRAIQWGWTQEPYARANYELDQMVHVLCPPFVRHKEFTQVGCSSDFLLPDVKINGEIKCFYRQSEHQKVVTYRQMPLIYVPQVQEQMWVHDYEITHFVSYDPRHPDWRARVVVVEIEQDPHYIEIMGNKVTDFLDIFNRGARPTERQLSAVPEVF